VGKKKYSGSKNNKETSEGLDAALVASIVWKVKQKSDKTTVDILAELQDLKEKGTAASKAGDARLASENWARACLDIMRLRQAPDFAKTYVDKPRDTPERQYVRKLAEMMFLLNLNLAQNTLKAMEASIADDDLDLAESLSGSALHALQKAAAEASVSDLTGMPVAAGGDRDGDIRGGWRASDAQMAKLWYRKARCHKLCKEWDDACQGIGLALRFAPTDATVLAEKESIIELASEMTEEEIDDLMYASSDDESSYEVLI